MPIYEYLCEECQEAFEKLVNKGEEVDCPKCHGAHIVKQYSRFGFASASSESKYDSLPQYKGGGCGCTPSSCGCKN
ncbi:MAG: hypothetical protein C5B54_07020 [Acidobacteria bacterium]|nr:MAG: hypothetical protein C5B54_07020 [Acidobacteriota bacterium]